MCDCPIIDAFGSTEGLFGSSAPDDPVLTSNDDVCISPENAP
jgi:hypothetical protein